MFKIIISLLVLAVCVKVVFYIIGFIIVVIEDITKNRGGDEEREEPKNPCPFCGRELIPYSCWGDGFDEKGVECRHCNKHKIYSRTPSSYDHIDRGNPPYY